MSAPARSDRPRILLVDDEPVMLQALARTLRNHFEVFAETGAPAALASLHAGEQFEVIVSDMRMPLMNGVTFLNAARTFAPDAVRIMLTGQADVATAAACVNEGQVFRFLEKPCAPNLLVAALTAAVEQHRLITSRRVLLEETLRGSINVLTDVLAMASPVAFSRAVRLKRTVGLLAAALDIADVWQIEVAALFSQLGAITLPPSLVEKLNRGEALDARELELTAGLPQVARQLISQIPRLEGVCAILDHEGAPFDGRTANRSATLSGEALPIGARLLKVAIDVDTLEAGGRTTDQISEVLRSRVGVYDPRVLAALDTLRHVAPPTDALIEVRLSDVRVGMIFSHDVAAATGLILIGRGQEATSSLVRRIQNHWSDMPLREPARIFAASAT